MNKYIVAIDGRFDIEATTEEEAEALFLAKTKAEIINSSQVIIAKIRNSPTG
jgi:hypothetical protein